MKTNSQVSVVGSIAYDDLVTSEGSKNDLLGGSAIYFSIAACNMSKVSIIGSVGEDFKKKDLELLESKQINIKHINHSKGTTFRWKGSYVNNSEEPETLITNLGVFKDFSPCLNEDIKKSQYVFLANISPLLQKKISKSLINPKRIVGLDTMNHWILDMKEDLEFVMKDINILFINKIEAFLFAKSKSIEDSANYIIEKGPKICIIKDGKNGSYLYVKNNETFFCPSYKIDKLIDPTGAGDSFAGGFFGYISNINEPTIEDFKEAMIYGTAIASITIEGFGINNLYNISKNDICKRVKEIKNQLIMETK
jgi:sugar/nucleoside kinase (ribokinase family)